MSPDEPERPPEESDPPPPPPPEEPAQPLVDFGTREEPPIEATYDEPYEEPAPATYAPRHSAAYEQPESEPYIPMPGEYAPRGDFHARDAQRNLDLDLGRIKRRKRYGFFLTTISVIFVAFFIVPVTWVGMYLFIDAPATLLMLQRAAEGETIRHQPVAMTHISPYMVRAVIASEDANFCTHHGFDVEAIQDAMEANADGRRLRGGSTVSQQTAKNLFLWPQRSWLRKGLETYFTALIEFMWPKQRIMEHYLNVAEWGDGIFGVQAAAQARFGVDAEDLTPLQAARLAAVLPSPNRYRADNPGPYVRRRSASIVQRAQVVRNEHMAACVLALDRSGA